MPTDDITGSTTLQYIDAHSRRSVREQITHPRHMPPTILAGAAALGDVAAAFDRQLTQPGDRQRVEISLGRLLYIISLTANSGGTTLARSLSAYLRQRPQPAPAPPR